jgi:hypothetical protein
MFGSFSTHGEEKRIIENFVKNSEGKRSLGRPRHRKGVIFKWEGVTGLMRYNIGTRGGMLWKRK